MSAFIGTFPYKISVLLHSIVGFYLLSAYPSFVAADPNFGGQPKFCKPFSCSKGQEPVQKWPLSFKSSGCGSIGGNMAVSFAGMSGDGDDPHESCCDQRAACLQTCGAVKTVCDETFQKCVKDVCEGSSDEEKCNKEAGMFSIMMNFEGCQNYDNEQYSHCECVATEDAPGRRQDLIRKFYKKFSPESIEKAEGLAKKADTPRKMANLLGKLVKKYYPKTIKKIKNPNQDMMDKIMREGSAKNDEEKQDDDGSDEGMEEDVQEL